MDPVDPTMIQAIRTYPAHSVNGYSLMKRDASGRSTDVPAERSFLFRIPTDGVVDGGGTAGGHVRPRPAVDPAVDMPIGTAAAAGSGKLRQLDE